MGFDHCNTRALSENPVISITISWMYNNANDVRAEIDNTLRVPLAFTPFSLNQKTITQTRRDGARDQRYFAAKMFMKSEIRVCSFAEPIAVGSVSRMLGMLVQS